MKERVLRKYISLKRFSGYAGIVIGVLIVKKDFSAEDICNSRSTACESDNYFVWQ
jgi:hypothetical protein